MPLEYSVVHSQRLVIAVARGSIIAEEVIAFIAKIDAENAQPYRKMFDVTELATVFADERIEQLAGLVRSRKVPSGPIAVVARSEHTLRQARVFASATGAARLIGVFEDQTGARRWLDELGGHA